MTIMAKQVNKSLFYQGNEQVVILFHSFTNHPKILWSLFTQLKKAGYTVYAPVLSGHEDNDLVHLLTYSANDWLADGLKAVQYMKDQGYSKIVTVGLSIGGLVAINSLVNDPSLIATASLSSPLLVSPKGSQVGQAFLKTHAARLRLESGLDEAEINTKQAEILPALTRVLDSMQQAALDLAPNYRTIDRPVFIGQGAADTLIDPDIAYHFKDQLVKAPDIDFHIYPDGKHYLTLGKSGQAVSQDFIKFLYNLTW